MKLLKILLENNWRPLTSSEVQDDQDELFKMINTAYAPIGGHPNVTSPSDIKSAADGYEVIDLDDDPEADATIMSKQRAGGTKLVGMGHDNSKPAKSAAVARTVNNLNKNGYYIEVSGKIFDILKLEHGLFFSLEDIMKVLNKYPEFLDINKHCIERKI